MEKEKCKFCGHQWTKRIDKPVACPKCQKRNYKE